jgi:hypothetical protein
MLILLMMECVYLQVCPICAMRVSVDMVAHITLQHGNIFKISFSFELLIVSKVAFPCPVTNMSK